MTKYTIEGKVISQHIFFNDSELADVQSVTMKPDICGMYFIHANKEANTRHWRKDWEELEINKVADGLYHLGFYDISSPYVRSEKPFMILEMTKQQVCDWHSNDVWFRDELNYFIRRAGKKFIKKGHGKRCIKCMYLQRHDATECDRGCKIGE